MQLMMYIGNDLIESITVDGAFLSVPGYLGNFKRQLKQKYQSLLEESTIQPEFLVINLTPATTSSSSSSPRISCQ
jgi:hypothetical protein